jgi:hypothetical protein
MTQEDYPTDFRALCAELVDAYAWCVDNYMTASADEDSLVQRARAALAQPEPQGPTDKELCKTLHQAICDFPPTHPSAHDLDGHQYEIALEIRKARAVLARWGK